MRACHSLGLGNHQACSKGEMWLRKDISMLLCAALSLCMRAVLLVFAHMASLWLTCQGLIPSDAEATWSAFPWVAVWWGWCFVHAQPILALWLTLLCCWQLLTFVGTKSSCSLKLFPRFPWQPVPEGICLHYIAALQLNSTRDRQSRTIHPANDFCWHTMAIHYRSGSVCPLFLIPAASKNNQKHPICLTGSQHNRR